jgi:hypothetical protein
MQTRERGGRIFGFITAVLAVMCSVFLLAALPASDNFPTNGATLGANWTDQSTASQFKVASFQATHNLASSGDAIAYWNADAFNGDHYSQADVFTNGAADPLNCGPAVRVQSSGHPANLYLLRTSDGGVFKIVTASYTQIGSSLGAFANGDTAQLSITGSVLTVSKNGSSLGSVTDGGASISGGSAGLWDYNTTGSTNSAFDNWSGGNVGAAAGCTTHGMLSSGVGCN